MKRIARILAVLAAAAVTLGLGMVSCDYWNEDWYKNGDSATTSPGSTGGSGSGERLFIVYPAGTDGTIGANLGLAAGDDMPRATVTAFKPSTTPPPSNVDKKFSLGGAEGTSGDTIEDVIIGWIDRGTLYYFVYGYSDKGRKIPVSQCQQSSVDGAFSSLPNLTEIDLSNWDTSHMTSMHGMFCNCTSLTSLDVSSWDTSRVTHMFDVFNNCTSLTSLNLSNWDTSRVTHMSSMFENCTSLTSLDLSSWNTSSVTVICRMFFGCSSLTSLDLSGWDTSHVTQSFLMFYDCSNLTTIYASPSFVAPAGRYGSDMFYGCTSLVGGAGTAFSASHTGGEYARIDGGPSSSTPGYFTAR